MFRNFFAREELSGRFMEGQGLVEYALIIVLVSIAAIVALTALSGGINKVFTDINTTLSK